MLIASLFQNLVKRPIEGITIIAAFSATMPAVHLKANGG